MKRFLIALGFLIALPAGTSASSIIGIWLRTKGPASVQKYEFRNNSVSKLTMADSSSMTLAYVLDDSKSPARITWYAGSVKVNIGIWTIVDDTLKMQGSSGDTVNYPMSFSDPSCYVLIANDISNLQGTWTFHDGPASIREFRFLPGSSGTMILADNSTISFSYVLDTISAPKRIVFYSGIKILNLGIWLVVGNVLTMQGSGGDTSKFPGSFSEPSHYVLNTNTVKGNRIDNPARFDLFPNYPNPFNPTTVVSFYVPKACHVSIRVFDLLGREVARLINGTMEPGFHSVQWHPIGLASGAYVCQMKAEGFIRAKRFLFQK